MEDSHLPQWSAAIGEVRTEATDMLGMVRGERSIVLTSLRRNLNQALSDIKRLQDI